MIEENVRPWHMAVMAALTLAFSVLIVIVVRPLGTDGNGWIFDQLLLGYSVEGYEQNKLAMGEAGIETYILVYTPLNLVFIAFYGLLGIVALGYYSRKQFPLIYKIGFVVLTVMLFLDLFENIRLTLLMTNLIPVEEQTIFWTSVMTSTKWLCFVIMLVLVGYSVARKVRGEANKPLDAKAAT